MADFGERALERLREDVRATMSEKRFAHTLGVEQTVAEMAALYCPEKTGVLRAAALLHDCTKEYDAGKSAQVLAREGITLRPDEMASPATHHAITAPCEIERLYPELADPVLLSAVRWHTTGHAGMTLCEAILYLADVIERGRRFADCIALREQFFGADPAAMSMAERRRHLRDVLLLSYDKTVAKLQARGQNVCLDTLYARDDLKNRSEF